MTEELSDEEIVRRVLAGKTDEFRVLVLKYQDSIYSLLVRQLPDREVAKELTQDCFVRAFRSLRSFEFRSSLGTWLIRIALNLANSYFSSAAYKRSLKTVSMETDRQDAPDSREPEVANTESRLTALQAALARLDPKFREPLVLCRLERKTYAEAGELLGIPEGTVCSRISTAVSELRKHMERQRR